ncbi:MAG TPA: S-adenosylmethionine:tRNA ribosyltransferase-isomerase, partial [Burkholderiaceae bacterium]|nr:S-adenosylmethionine:tRNA ribosyltransferase-isomerase [Burkholderiaceae bacterium]
MTAALRAAREAVQRPPHARLLWVRADGAVVHRQREHLAELLRTGDVVVANDAATLPASLHGTHEPTAAPIELRLAGRRSLRGSDVHRFQAIVFGAGDHRTRTEDRAPPPPLQPGDGLRLGPLHATVQRRLGHPRLIELRFDGDAGAVWAGLAQHGHPIQYAHITQPLALWDVWSAIAALPVAFEPPSAGFVLDWSLLQRLRQRGIGFATLTHAAGISSTGDTALDRQLPFDEPYRIPPSTETAIAQARSHGGRVVAVGTTVTRALEHAARGGRLRAGNGVADQRIGRDTRLRVVDAIVSGTHEPATSHHELLRAFADPAVLQRADRALAERGYLTHEFGDSVLIERTTPSLTSTADARLLALTP